MPAFRVQNPCKQDQLSCHSLPWRWRSRTLTLPSPHSAYVEPTEIFVPTLRESAPICSRGVSSCCTTAPLPVWSALPRTRCSQCAGRCWTIRLTVRSCYRVTSMCSVPSRKRSAPYVRVDRRLQGCGGVVVQQQSGISLLRRGIGWNVNGMHASPRVGTIFNALCSFAQKNPERVSFEQI
jgi:hypothetical protein